MRRPILTIGALLTILLAGCMAPENGDSAMNGMNGSGGMDGMNGMGDMDGMPHTEVRLPPVQGFYEGEKVFFVHSEASDEAVAQMLTDMMGGSPVLVVPALADAPRNATDEVYVFQNGIKGTGPFGFQPDVFPSAPGDDTYSPLRRVVLVNWAEDAQPRELNSAEDLFRAETDGELAFKETQIIVNMPFLTWPGGQR